MSKIHLDSRMTKSLLLPMAVAGMIAGFTVGCSEEKQPAPAPAASSSKQATPPADKAGQAGAAAATEKHSCAGQNSCKGKGGCKTGDNGCAGKNSCKGKGGCEMPVKPH
jgi:hypothetical protein